MKGFGQRAGFTLNVGCDSSSYWNFRLWKMAIIMKKVLHVGCGSATIERMPVGYRDGNWQEVRFDISPQYKPDYIGTMLDMESVPDESMDSLYSSHNIEHVFYHEVPLVLSEFRRVLKDDGFCIITCPDIQEVAKSMAEGKLDTPLYHSPGGPISAIDIMYGHSAAIERGEVYMAHKTGFNLQLLAKRVQEAGFGQFFGMKRPAQRDLWILACKREASSEKVEDLFYTFTGFQKP